MIPARRHAKEEARLLALQEADILDTPSEAAFDRLARLAAHVTGCPIALFSLVDRDRQWFKSKVGIVAAQTGRDESFCAHAVASESTLVVPDAAHDDRFHDNPLVRADPHIRFYAGIPIRTENGLPVGTLCVIDRVPRELARGQMDALKALAHEMESQLWLRGALDEAETEQDERKQMTALLVHDLRNPLTSIIGGAACLAVADELSPSSREIVAEMIEAGQRIQRMAFQLLDESSRGRANLTPALAPLDLAAFFARLTTTLTLTAKLSGHQICTERSFDDRASLRTDEGLLRRVMDNLVDNALKFSPGGSTVRVEVAARRGEPFLVRITDAGPGIPADQRARIFDSGVRLGEASSRPQGWGLGLQFCHRATRALGGSIEVRQAVPHGAVFELRLPGI